MTESWAILDLRGLVLHCFNFGTDPDAEGKGLTTPGYTVDRFIQQYLDPILDLVPLNKIIAVNEGGNEFRKRLYPEYKANRKPSEPELKAAHVASMQAVQELLKALGVVQCQAKGIEADDVIAYLCGNLPGTKLVYTVDQDMIALVNTDTHVFLKGNRMTDMKGVLPRHVALYKSLVGDPSDNIKGVPGFGPKSWESLVSAYDLDGLDELIEIADRGGFSKIRHIVSSNPGAHPLLKLIDDNLPKWTQSYSVAKLRPDLVDASYDGEFRRIQWTKRLPSKDRLIALGKSIGSSYLASHYSGILPRQHLVVRGDIDQDSLAEMQTYFKASRFVSIDWETVAQPHQPFLDASEGGNYVDVFGSKIVSAGVTCGANLEHTFFFNFGHADEENRIDKQFLVDLIRSIPEGMPIVAQNTSFERTVFMHEFGKEIPNLHDTKLMASHIEENESSGLKDLSKAWLNYDQIRYDEVIEKGKTMADYPVAHVFKYGADDPLVTGHLYDLFKIILYLEGTEEFVRTKEFPAMYPISDGHLAGVSIDYEEVERQHREDKESFYAAHSRVRHLLETNSDPDGYRVWLKECETIFDAETAWLKRRLDSLHNPEGDKKLAPWIEDAAPPETSYDEALENSRRCARLLLPEKVKKSCTYVAPFVRYEFPPFVFTVSKLNVITEARGWPAIQKLSRAFLSSYVDQTIGLVNDLGWEAFALTVAELLDKPAPDRKGSREFATLARLYEECVPKKEVKEGTDLNLGSYIQMQQVLYGMLGLPISLRSLDPSKGRIELGLEGAAQTDEDAIKDALYVQDVQGWKREVLEEILKARKADTRIKLFYKKLPLWRHPLDGNTHPQFNQAGTVTRRPTGSAPNMLQLPKKDEGLKLRRCILPNKKLGHDLVVSIDWDGEELRVLAGVSGDKKLTACYVGDDKLDPHSLTAAERAGVSYADFVKVRSDPDHPNHKQYDGRRKDAKAVNFGSTYGIGTAKLARKALMPAEEAKAYLDAKRRVYAGVETWRHQVIEFLHKNGYVQTLYGTRKHIYNKLKTNDDGMISYYERASVNQMIQGVCADYLKSVLTDIWEQGILQNTGAVLIAPIYDELAFSVHSSRAVELILGVYACMTQGIPGLPIPMLANPSLGRTFGDQIEILKDCYEPLTRERIEAAINKALLAD